MKYEIKSFLLLHAGDRFSNKEIASALYLPEASVRRVTRQLCRDDFSVQLNACTYPIKYYVYR